MNRIFKVVWSTTKHCYVVTSELAKSHSRSSSRSQMSIGGGFLSSAIHRKSWLRSALVLTLLGGIGLGTQVEASYLYAGNGSVGSNEVTGQVKNTVALNPSKYGTNDAGRSVKDKTTEESIVIGTDAEALARGSISIGFEASVEKSAGKDGASLDRSTVIGYGSKATDNPFNILGTGNHNGGGQATVIGSNSVATSQATGVGNNVYAIGRSSIAIGNDDVDSYKNPVTEYDAEHYFAKLYANIDKNGGTYGYSTDDNGKTTLTKPSVTQFSPTLAQGDGSIAIGSRSLAYDSGATALGTLAFALKKGSTAIGTETRAEGMGALAFGNETYVFSNNSIAVGSKSQVINTGGSAYGYKTYAGGENSMAFGRDVYANTKMTFGQLNGKDVFSKDGVYNLDPTKGVRSILGNKSLTDVHATPVNGTNTNGSQTYIDMLEGLVSGDPVTDDPTKIIPGLQYATVETATKNGVQNIVQDQGKNAIVIGSRSLAVGDNGLALGRGAIERGNNGMAVGSYSMTTGENSLAFGLAARALDKNTVALGTAAAVMGEQSMALGIGAINYGTRSTVVGNQSGISSDSNGSMIFGNNVVIGKGISNSIAIGSQASIGRYIQGGNSLIYELDPDTGKAKSSTAVASIDEMQQDNIRNAMAIGANARVYSRETGIVAASENDTLARRNGNNAMAIGNGAEAWLENSLALGVNSKTDYSPEQLATDAWRTPDAIAVSTSSKVGVISVGSLGNERRIVNVAAGAFDTDAVNVSQLKQVYDTLRRSNSGNSSGSHFTAINYTPIDTKTKDYVKASIIQSAYKQYVDTYKDYKSYLVKEAYGGAKLTDSAKNSFNKQLTDLEKAMKAYGVSDETIKNMSLNSFGGGEKTYDTNGNITAVTVDTDKLLADSKNVETALAQLNDAEQTDTAVLDKDGNAITGMTDASIESGLDNINYTNKGANGKGSSAFGYSAKAMQDGSVALGYQAQVLATTAPTVTGAGSVALGGLSTVTDVDITNAQRDGLAYTNEKPTGNALKPNGGVVSFGTAGGNGTPEVTRRLIHVAAGTDATDAVNVGQLESLAAQTVTLTDDTNSKTKAQTIGKNGGISFGITGGTDITTTAGDTGVSLALNKATTVTNTGDDATKAVTAGAVYTAVTNAKTKISLDPNSSSLLTLTKNESNDLTGNSYVLSLKDGALAGDVPKLSYKADTGTGSVELTTGLTFSGDSNLTARAEDNGVISYGLKADLTGINSIAGLTSLTGNGATLTFQKNSIGLNAQLDMGNHKITNLTNGDDPKDAVNYSQLQGVKTEITNVKNELTNAINNITPGTSGEIANNTVRLEGSTKPTGVTNKQALNNDGGLVFSIAGNNDISSTTTATGVSLALNKASAVTNGADKDKVVTAGAVYNAVTGAKTTITLGKNAQGLLKLESTEPKDLTGNSYVLSLEDGAFSGGTTPALLSYKAGTDKDARTVALSKGLTFSGDSNLTAKAEDNGVISYGLNKDLTGINSITGNGGAVLTFDSQGLSLNQSFHVKNNITVGSSVNFGNDSVKLENKGGVLTLTQKGQSYAVATLNDGFTIVDNNGNSANIKLNDTIAFNKYLNITPADTTNGSSANTGDASTDTTNASAGGTSATTGNNNTSTGNGGATAGGTSHTSTASGDNTASTGTATSPKATIDVTVKDTPTDERDITNKKYVDSKVEQVQEKLEKTIETIKERGDGGGKGTIGTGTSTDSLSVSGKTVQEYLENNYTNNTVLNQKLGELSQRANAGTASALAAAGIPQVTNMYSDDVMIGAGVGSYGGESAVAIGVSGMNTNRDKTYKVAATYDSTGKWGMSVGLGFSVGIGTNTPKPAAARALSERVSKLESTNKELAQRNEQLLKEVTELKQLLTQLVPAQPTTPTTATNPSTPMEQREATHSPAV